MVQFCCVCFGREIESFTFKTAISIRIKLVDMWSEMMAAHYGKRVPTFHPGASVKRICTARQVGILFVNNILDLLSSMMEDQWLI